MILPALMGYESHQIKALIRHIPIAPKRKLLLKPLFDFVLLVEALAVLASGGE